MRKKAILAMLAALIVLTAAGQNQPGTGYYNLETEIVDGDTILAVYINPVLRTKSGQAIRSNSEYDRLVYNLKKVYPIAKEANRLLRETQKKLEGLSKNEQKAYIKEMEDRLKEEYTPVLKTMTFSQGKLLIKLIDRETSHTSYELVKELRGSFSAFFWQSIARIFGANLKDVYDKEGDDKTIEQLIMMIEMGVL